VGEQIRGYFYPTAEEEYNNEIDVGDEYVLYAATSVINHVGKFTVNGYSMFSRFPQGNYSITSVQRDNEPNFTRYEFTATKTD
jgi:hypothetical protein